jgi:uncharacterized membrane protein
MWLFKQDGFDNALRISHVIVAIMWMGLLWFFNFVQVPAYAEMDAAARNNALDKLTWRALWWFRWAAVATIVFGLLIIAVWPDVYDGTYWKSTAGVTLLLGIIMGVTMGANVWMVIWPNQRRVLAAMKAGEAPDPAWSRNALYASRTNFALSFPMLFFMAGSSHYPLDLVGVAVVGSILAVLGAVTVMTVQKYQVARF